MSEPRATVAAGHGTSSVPGGATARQGFGVPGRGRDETRPLTCSDGAAWDAGVGMRIGELGNVRSGGTPA